MRDVLKKKLIEALHYINDGSELNALLRIISVKEKELTNGLEACDYKTNPVLNALSQTEVGRKRIFEWTARHFFYNRTEKFLENIHKSEYGEILLPKVLLHREEFHLGGISSDYFPCFTMIAIEESPDFLRTTIEMLQGQNNETYRKIIEGSAEYYKNRPSPVADYFWMQKGTFEYGGRGKNGQPAGYRHSGPTILGLQHLRTREIRDEVREIFVQEEVRRFGSIKGLFSLVGSCGKFIAQICPEGLEFILKLREEENHRDTIDSYLIEREHCFSTCGEDNFYFAHLFIEREYDNIEVFLNAYEKEPEKLKAIFTCNGTRDVNNLFAELFSDYRSDSIEKFQGKTADIIIDFLTKNDDLSLFNSVVGKGEGILSERIENGLENGQYFLGRIQAARATLLGEPEKSATEKTPSSGRGVIKVVRDSLKELGGFMDKVQSDNMRGSP